MPSLRQISSGRAEREDAGEMRAAQFHARRRITAKMEVAVTHLESSSTLSQPMARARVSSKQPAAEIDEA